MPETNTTPDPAPRVFPATVVKVLNESDVVINRGATNGVKAGQRFLIYQVDREELSDPHTGESLGHVEIVRGTGVVTHVQEKLSTIASDRKSAAEKRIVKRPGDTISALISGRLVEEETIVGPSEPLPFDDARVGDFAKPI